jgi:hypothetical protein
MNLFIQHTLQQMRGRIFGFILIFGLIVIPVRVLAAEVVTTELTETVNDVTVTQGSSTSFTISVSATGKLDPLITSSSPSTAKVKTSYSLIGGALSSSTFSSALNFFAGTNGCGGGNCNVTWTGAPTPYTVAATISADATTAPGNYTIVLSTVAGTVTIANPNENVTKLADADVTNIVIHVVAAPTATPTLTPTPTNTSRRIHHYPRIQPPRRPPIRHCRLILLPQRRRTRLYPRIQLRQRPPTRRQIHQSIHRPIHQPRQIHH